MSLLKQFRENWGVRFGNVQGAILMAVSGGRDSMVLADLLLKSGINIGVAHCNFGLRGDESDGDEVLVKAWCELKRVAFHNIKFDTKREAAERKTGTQETARDLRYEWFEQVRSEFKYAKIATAHHANDNVETLLINLFKGTGISGLHGILPQNGAIIRPLLFASREDITQYAFENSLLWRDDASNNTDDYLRNDVRHNLVPVIERLFPNAVDRVNESINRFAEAEILYNKAIEQERRKLIEKRGNDYYIPILKLKKHEPLATLCYELFQPFGFNSKQVPHIINLLDSETGHFITSATRRIIHNRDFLIVTSLPLESADFIAIDALPFKVVQGKYQYAFSIEDKPKTIPKTANEVYIDMEQVVFPLILRKWKIGDYLYPFGMKMKKKKVSRILIDEKVSINEKEELRVLECSKRIAWVSGIRSDERFRVKEGTNKVLVVRRSLTV